jgi:hypothetical protein
MTWVEGLDYTIATLRGEKIRALYGMSISGLAGRCSLHFG